MIDRLGRYYFGDFLRIDFSFDEKNSEKQTR